MSLPSAVQPYIRTAQPADANALSRLARALLEHEHELNTAYDLQAWAGSADELRKQLGQPDTRFFVAEQGETLVGYLKVVLHGHEFTRAELGWKRWCLGLMTNQAKQVFQMLLRRPRPNAVPVGGYIAGAFVLPEWRRSHVGHALVAAAENWLRQCGMEVSELHVLYVNEQAREFWTNLGYEPLTLGLRKNL